MPISSINDLIKDDKNANRGTPKVRKLLSASLKKLGAGRSIVIDRDGRIIAGNKTVESAKAAGLEDVIVVESDGKKIVAVQRTDISLDDAAGRELAIADNRVAELDLKWDAAVLEGLSAEIDLKPFWSPDQLDRMFGTAERETMDDLSIQLSVIVSCKDEPQQAELLTELESRGFTCKLMST